MRALHATPRLVQVRLDSHRYVTDKLVEVYARHLPDVNREELWQRLRLSVELGFAADEMMQEETRISQRSSSGVSPRCWAPVWSDGNEGPARASPSLAVRHQRSLAGFSRSDRPTRCSISARSRSSTLKPTSAPSWVGS